MTDPSNNLPELSFIRHTLPASDNDRKQFVPSINCAPDLSLDSASAAGIPNITFESSFASLPLDKLVLNA